MRQTQGKRNIAYSYSDRVVVVVVVVVVVAVVAIENKGLQLWLTALVRFPAVLDFSVLHQVQTDSEAPPQPSIQWVPGALSLGIRRQGREAEHSPSSSAEVKNGRAIPSLLHISSWHNALSTGTTLPFYDCGCRRCAPQEPGVVRAWRHVHEHNTNSFVHRPTSVDGQI
jgi:hypothetical protein